MKNFALFTFGGIIYCTIEVLDRQWTHFSMFLVGGFCFMLIGSLRRTRLSVTEQMLVSAVIITAIELISGLILNVWLGLNVWDYSDKRFNLMGQICLHASSLWVFVSFVGIYANFFACKGIFKEKIDSMRILP